MAVGRQHLILRCFELGTLSPQLLVQFYSTVDGDDEGYPCPDDDDDLDLLKLDLRWPSISSAHLALL